MKRVIALIVAFTFITALLWAAGPPKTVYAEEYRNGFMLMPSDYDSTGISTSTDFILKPMTNTARNKYPGC